MLYKALPYSIFKPLFGDRKKWELFTDYEDNQKRIIGTTVNHFGFKIMEHSSFISKITSTLDENFSKTSSKKEPFNFLPIDLNLSYSFIYRNDK